MTSNSRRNRNTSRRNRGGSGADVSDCCDVVDLFGPSMLGLFTVAFAMTRTVPHSHTAPSGPSGRVAAMLWRRVRAYQLFVSTRRPACCPMTPTCSRYALDALSAHGTVRGLWLTMTRLRRCRPGLPSGVDPVPAAR